MEGEELLPLKSRVRSGQGGNRWKGRIRLRHTGGLLRYRDLQSEEQDWTAEGRPGWSDRVHCIASGGALGGVKN